MTKYANDVNAGATIVETMDCANCGLIFGIDSRFIARRREDGRGFYCPNGHSLTFEESDADRLRRRVKSLEARNTHERDQRQAAERSARAFKGQVTKIKNRVRNGVCPACNRSFADLHRHMEGQHSHFADGAQ